MDCGVNRVMLKPLRIFSTLILVSVTPHGASACVDFAEFEPADMAAADAILVGEIIDYQIVSPEKGRDISDYAIITMQIDKSLKGNQTGKVELYWENSTFGLPEELLVTQPALVAVVLAENEGMPSRGPSAKIFPTRRPDRMQVLQAPCSSAFILPHSKAVSQAVQQALQGSIDWADVPSDAKDAQKFYVLKASRRSEGIGNLGLIAATAGIMLFFSGLVWLRRLR